MNVPSDIHFDDALNRLTDTVIKIFGVESLQQGVVLRDTSGRLSFVVAAPAEAEERRQEAEANLRSALGPYAREDRLIIYKDDPGAELLLSDPGKLLIKLLDQLFCRVVDRRIVGSGWLEQPADYTPTTPRIVFASLKGGVGRSTAIAIAAADLARRNKNVLVVDLDLEAPGLGTLLLDDERTPEFGSVDFLVENGISEIPESALQSFIGTSALTTGGGGRVDVIPAFGQRSNSNPENVLPKLARAMIEDIGPDGSSVSIGTQIADMLDRMSNLNSYDVVLIDSRAGLAELTAPAVLGLGATILLFGTAQSQTISGYRALFAALNLLALRDRDAGRLAEWRLMFKAVYAKASFDKEINQTHIDNLYELFADYLYDAQSGDGLSDDEISFDIDDEDAPHWPIMIPFNSGFIDFDPIRSPNQLSTAFYEQTFRAFLDKIDLILETVDSNESEKGSPPFGRN